MSLRLQSRAFRFKYIHVTLGVAAFTACALILTAYFALINTRPPTGTYPDTLPSNITAPPTSLSMQPTTAFNEMTFVAAPQKHGISAGGGLWWVGEPEIDAYFRQTKELGATWVRWDLDWSLVQPKNESSYDWAKIDLIVNTAKKHGLTSLPIITYTPQWARSSLCWRHDKCRPLDPESFGRFARAAAERYKDRVHHWEIWNEQNYTMFWEPKPSTTDYAKVLKAAYTNIKAVDKSAIVVSGGLAAMGDSPGGDISAFTFVRSLYEQGANQYFDAVALHPYTFPISPDFASPWNPWRHIQNVRQLMVDKGDSAKQIWITEFGTPTSGPGTAYTLNSPDGFSHETDYMTEEAQKQIAEQALTFYQSRTDWMGPFFWYTLQDSKYNTQDIGNNYGLMRRDGSKKPVYDVLKARIR